MSKEEVDLKLHMGIRGFYTVNFNEVVLDDFNIGSYLKRLKVALDGIVSSRVVTDPFVEDIVMLEQLLLANPNNVFLDYKNHLRDGIEGYIALELGLGSIKDSELQCILNSSYNVLCEILSNSLK